MADEPQPDGASGSAQAQLESLIALYRSSAAEGDVSPAVTDAITQALVMILGSGPALGAYQGLLDAQNANGIMYYNAVANQQKANMLAMAMTAKCVRYMMDGPDGADDHGLDEMLSSEHS